MKIVLDSSGNVELFRGEHVTRGQHRSKYVHVCWREGEDPVSLGEISAVNLMVNICITRPDGEQSGWYHMLKVAGNAHEFKYYLQAWDTAVSGEASISIRWYDAAKIEEERIYSQVANIGFIVDNGVIAQTVPLDSENKDQILSEIYHDKQDNLVSGQNIKTVNGQSLLGSGNVEIKGGTGGGAVESVNGVEPDADGNVSLSADSVGAVPFEPIPDEPLIDENDKINTAYLPDYILGQMIYGGTFVQDQNPTDILISLTNAGASKLVSAGLSENISNDQILGSFIPPASAEGIYFISSANGITFSGISFETGDWLVSTANGWTKIDNTDAVQSVNGKTGAVVLTAKDVGALSTSDSANTTAINQKTVTNKYLSPYYVDQIVKAGAPPNTIDLTDEEKAAACQWLGAANKEYVDSSIQWVSNTAENLSDVLNENILAVNVSFTAGKDGTGNGIHIHKLCLFGATLFCSDTIFDGQSDFMQVFYKISRGQNTSDGTISCSIQKFTSTTNANEVSVGISGVLIRKI